MNRDQKFQQRWEFRRKDDDVDSSSDNSESDSGNEPVQKKNKVLSNLVLPQKDEESDTPRSQQNNQLNVTTGVPFQITEVNNEGYGSGKKRIAAVHRSKSNSGKKRKRKVNHTKEPAQLADLKIFTESLLEELRVARDTMFLQMMEQITKLIDVSSALRTRRKDGSCLVKTDKAIHPNENGSGVKTENCHSGLRERAMKSFKAVSSSKCLKDIGKRTNREQGPVANGTAKRENFSLPVKKPINDSDQTVSSSYLTLPRILSRPKIESLRMDFSLIDHIHAGCATNSTKIFERANFLTCAHGHHGYLPGILPDEQLGSLSQMVFKSTGFFDQQSNQTPMRDPGFEVPLRQWPNNCLGITNQIVLGTPGQENRSIGLRMNGGGMSHALSESFVTNNISCNMKNDTDAVLVSFRSQDIGGENIFRK